MGGDLATVPEGTQPKEPSWLETRLRILYRRKTAPEQATGADLDQVWPPPQAPDPPGAADDYIHSDRLETASKWAAGGFTTLLALLLFFGIKEGVLDQALRLEPLASLCVVLFLGGGLLAALFAPALDPDVRMKLWLLFAAIAVMTLIAAAFLPDVVDLLAVEGEPTATDWWETTIFKVAMWAVAILAAITIPVLWEDRHHPQRGTLTKLFLYVCGAVIVVALFVTAATISAQSFAVIGLTLLFLGIVAASFATDAAITAAGGVIVLGVAATSLGLYGAAKLSVGSKLLAVDPRVTAAVGTAEEQPVLSIDVEAARLRGKMVKVWVTGTPRLDIEAIPGESASTVDEELRTTSTIWTSTLEPDALDSVDSEINVPLLPSRWEELSVNHCIVDATAATGPDCRKGSRESTVLTMSNMTRGMELTGRIEPVEPKVLEVSLVGEGVAPGTRIVAQLCRRDAEGQRSNLVLATLAPDSDGEVDWSFELPVGPDGESVELQYMQCGPGLACPRDMARLAMYRQP